MADDNHTPQIISRKDARAAGLKRYFTGEICQQGHVAERRVCDATCTVCAAENYRKWKAANREKENARSRQRWRDNPERMREICRESMRRRRAAMDPDARRAQERAYYRETAEAAKAKSRKWAIANPEKRRAWEANRKARKRASTGTHTAGDVQQIFDLQRSKCACCKKSIKKGYHVDHIMPLSRGGSNGRENLQLLCAPCNLTKHDKHPVEWAQAQGWLI